ncbi:MAG: hypothetical protein WDW36_007276 [Sanguina aurantia]
MDDPLSFGNVDISDNEDTFAPAPPHPHVNGGTLYPPVPASASFTDPFSSTITSFELPSASFQSSEQSQQRSEQLTGSPQPYQSSSSSSKMPVQEPSSSSVAPPTFVYNPSISSTSNTGTSLRSGYAHPGPSTSAHHDASLSASDRHLSPPGIPTATTSYSHGGSGSNTATASQWGAATSSRWGEASGVSRSGGARPATRVVVHSPSCASGPTSIPGVMEVYMCYVLTTTTSLPSYAASDFSVKRRFKDVVALADMLQELYPGYFVPPRPSRNALEGYRMTPKFIEDRRLSVERFLNRLALHPTIGHSQTFQLFLELDGSLSSSVAWKRLLPSGKGPGLHSVAKFFKQVVGSERCVPKPSDVTRSAASAGDMYRLMHEKVAGLRGILKESLPSPTEQALRDEGRWVDDVRERLVRLSRAADHWVTRTSEKAVLHDELGGALRGLGSYEESSGFLCGLGEEAVSEGCSRVGKLLTLTTEHSARHLTALNDTLAAMGPASAALAHRESTLLTALTLERDAVEKRARLALLETDVSRNSKKAVGLRRCVSVGLRGCVSVGLRGCVSVGLRACVSVGLRRCVSVGLRGCIDALRFDLAMLDTAVLAARAEYERVTERNVEEVVAFKATMRRELVVMIQEFAMVQVAGANKAQQMWQETAHALPGR